MVWWLQWILASILGVTCLLVLIYFHYDKKNKDYWSKRGVRTILPQHGMAAGILAIVMKWKSVADMEFYNYSQMKEGKGKEGTGPVKMAGTVDLGAPTLVLRDPELIRQVLVKDFDYFVDRRKMKVFNMEPVLKLMLTNLEGAEWKHVRGQISPTFTTGKIRRMFEHFNSCSEDLVGFIKRKPVGAPTKREVVVKEAMSRYLVDVIGSTAFGMRTNALNEESSVFYDMTKRISTFSLGLVIKALIVMALPWLTKLGIRATEGTAMTFFEDILRKALKVRQEGGGRREDFLQLLIDAKKGELKKEKEDEVVEAFEKDAELKKEGGDEEGLSDDMIVAQSLLFFLAGLDTTGTVLCFAVYFLALHPEIQDKLREEVDKGVRTEVKEGELKVEYDKIVKMDYLDKFISEILRMYPPGIRLERKVTKEYQVPGTDFKVEKDHIVAVPVLAIHHDPEFYPDPEKFDPERFTPEAKAARHPYTYLPFGQGPRNCIGMRFALMEAKVAIAYLVRNFIIEPSTKTPVPMKLDPQFGVRPVTDLELSFRERV